LIGFLDEPNGLVRLHALARLAVDAINRPRAKRHACLKDSKTEADKNGCRTRMENPPLIRTATALVHQNVTQEVGIHVTQLRESGVSVGKPPIPFRKGY
jgi:hypothetical protein